MFCTIEDAWGSGLQSNLQVNTNDEKRFTDKEIFQQSDKPESFKTNEFFSNSSPNKEHMNILNESTKEDLYNKYIELKEMFQNKEKKESEVCIALDNHLQKCYRCRSKYMNQMENYNNNYNNGFDLSKIMVNIGSNKDMITIFLFGLLIILLLQLFSSKSL
jgi:hypothetical protein